MKIFQKINRTGQIQMTETIAVLFIFFVLIAFGMIFYFKYSTVALKEKQQEVLAARAMDTTLRTLFLPELICSKGEAEAEDNCVDMVKARYAANSTFPQHKGVYYYSLFGFAEVVLQEVYPGNNTLILYSHPKPQWERKEPTYFVVALRDETRGTDNPVYGMGYLKVEVYS